MSPVSLALGVNRDLFLDAATSLLTSFKLREEVVHFLEHNLATTIIRESPIHRHRVEDQYSGYYHLTQQQHLGGGEDVVYPTREPDVPLQP
jgi:hypothetical protein